MDIHRLKTDPTLKTNPRLAPQWHRVGRQNFYKARDVDDIDVPEVARVCREKLIAYLEKTVPRMTELLNLHAPHKSDQFEGNQLSSAVA